MPLIYSQVKAEREYNEDLRLHGDSTLWGNSVASYKGCTSKSALSARGGGATSGVIELVSFQRDLHRREI